MVFLYDKCFTRMKHLFLQVKHLFHAGETKCLNIEKQVKLIGFFYI